MMHEKWVEAAGTRTRYFDIGLGDTVIVFLHGGLFSDEGVCHNALVFEQSLPGFAAAGLRVVAFDALGHGRSAAPTSDADCSVPGLVAHAEAVIGALRLGSVHLAGHDEGGLVGLRLAFKSPQLLRSCVIIAGRAVVPAGDPLSNLTLAAPLQPRYGRAAQAWVLERQSHSQHHIHAGNFLEEAVAIAADDAFRGLRARIEAGDLLRRYMRPSLGRARLDNWKRFREDGVPVPTLLVWGGNDPICPVQNARSLFGLMAAKQRITQLHLIGRAGYLPFREQAPSFNEILGGFVRALEQTRSAKAA
ncbi:Pimeloyl-ACP methyl ester carboxylesterase [Rhizobiales bacterium GAS191]|nr:Pimeloyl-ACP methyl ester carboxylesterase [Rhizobiales bacterium GAS191]